MCHLPPIHTLQEPLDAEIFQDEHNSMGCNFVSEDMFDLMQQPIMDSTVISESEFDSILKCLTDNTQGVDADTEVDKTLSLQSMKMEPSETERSVTSVKKKIQCPCCPKEFISRLRFHKHYEKLHELKLCTEKNEDSVQQNMVRPQRGRGKGPQNGEQSSPSAQTCNNPKKVVSPNINNPKKGVSPNINNPKKVVSPNVNNPKKIVSPNVKIETEKPVTNHNKLNKK